jgi:hypothetical protein
MINFVDESGNVGFQINEEGLRVTEVIAGEHKLSEKANVSDIPSLDGYAKTEDIPSLDGLVKTEDLPNFDEFAKTEDIPSLDGYAKTSDIPSLDGYAKTEDIPSLDNYASKEWVNNKNYATEYDLKTIDYSSINNIPTLEDETGELNIADESGNIGMKVASEAVYAKDFVAGEHRLSEKVGPNSLKTINGESIIGDGDITIGGSDVYVTDFCIDDLHQIISEIEESIHIDAEGIINAVNENKVISIPINRENSRGGYIAHVEDYEDYINFYVNYDIFSLSFWIDKIEVTNELNGENITFIELQSYLVSGESIKTINGEEILGEGDMELATKEEMNAKADDSSVVHIEGDEAINGTKTFYGAKFLSSGDNAIVIGPDTRVGVEGTTSTVLGLIRGTFFAGSSSYPLYLRGSLERPIYNVNDVELALLSDVNAKQDALISGANIKTINGETILGSGDITISGGSSNGSGAYAEVNHGTSDTTFALTPNTFHVWDEVPSLTLTLGSETAGVANEYLFQFTSGSEATTLTMSDNVKWSDELVIEPNMIYQVSILKGLASVLEFSNAPSVVANKVTVSVSGTKYLVSLQYAAASDIVVKVRTPDGPISVNILSGEISKTANPIGPMVDSSAYIESITPAADNNYTYT